MDKQDDRVRFQLKLPPGLHRRLKVEAAKRDMHMNDLLTWMLRHQLGQLETGQMDEAAP